MGFKADAGNGILDYTQIILLFFYSFLEYYIPLALIAVGIILFIKNKKHGKKKTLPLVLIISGTVLQLVKSIVPVF